MLSPMKAAPKVLSKVGTTVILSSLSKVLCELMGERLTGKCPLYDLGLD